MNVPLPSAPMPHRLSLAGADVVLDPAGALWWPAERILVVSDLHLEKGSSFAARRGLMLPPYDTAATLAALARLVAAYAPATIVALGDSFHDRDAEDRLAPVDRAALAELQRGRTWVWIAGNHDPDGGASLPGERRTVLDCGPLCFRHAPEPGVAPGEVAGHLHPVAKVALEGRNVRRRCFAAGDGRLVMPAFGAYAGGLNVCDPAFRPIFPTGLTAHLLGETRLYALPARLLRPD